MGEPAAAATTPACAMDTPELTATRPLKVAWLAKRAVGEAARVARKLPQMELTEPEVQVSLEGGYATVVATIMLPAVTLWTVTIALPPADWVRAAM